MRWHKRLFLNLENPVLWQQQYSKSTGIVFSELKPEKKKTDNPKFQDHLEGKEMEVGTSKYFPGTYFSLQTHP